MKIHPRAIFFYVLIITLFFTHLPIPPTYLKPTLIISHFSTLRNEKDTRVAKVSSLGFIRLWGD
nr:MAG TPA: hypothetical protein [Caudoviricetes sp.]